MRTITRIMIAATTAATGMAFAPSVVNAGQLLPPTVEVVTTVEGVDSATILPTAQDQLRRIQPGTPETLAPDELTVSDTGSDCQTPPGRTGQAFADRDRTCDIAPIPTPTEFFLTLDSLPTGLSLEVDCEIGERGLSPQTVETIDGHVGVRLSIDPVSYTYCEMYLLPPTNLSVVLNVPGADDPGGDFDVATLLDPITVDALTVPGGTSSATGCVSETRQPPGFDTPTPTAGLDGFRLVECNVPNGDYQLALSNLPNGLVVDSIECLDYTNSPDDSSDPQGASFTIDDDLTDCDVDLRFVRQTFSADVLVTNDDGGTADAGALLIEVYDADGNLVASKPDPEPGTENASAEFTLGIGTYTFGLSGADGYDVTVEVRTIEIAVLADQASSPLAIPGAASTFTISQSQTVAAIITANDPPMSTTTTTTPPPSTTITAELPATGDNSTGAMALIALAMLLLGGGIVAATRRTRTS